MENKLIVLTSCDDGTCCCLTARSTVALISILNLFACVTDMMTYESCKCCDLREHIDSLRILLVTLFQMANFLLLLASIVESALLVQIYVWYTLGFVVMGFVVALIDFLYRMKHEGLWSFVTLVPEIVFLFAIFRCLPLVDTYRRHINGETSIKN